MKDFWRKATTLLRVQYAYMVEYRAELLLWALSGSLPLILLGVWTQAAQRGQLGLSSLDFARYFLSVFIVRQLTVIWVVWEFEQQVVQGKLSPRLLLPIDPVWEHVASHVAERLARLPFIVGLAALFFVLYPGAFWIPSLGKFLLFLLVVASTFVLRFLMQYTFALFSFWTERASAIEEVWMIPYLFLSGLIAPLEVFPPLVREIALWLPFPYLVHFPASILVGLPVDVGRGLLVMLGWGGVFLVLNRWLWKKGLKQYSGMGA
ncbi:ABC transporter permease [Anthocerotibacter panamensis]|uniref:ABC transporter permease n=1 Tax=Anthocerotibacter panamensis TaxID=2857077 RepID=UPI001C4084F0|nr:ABC-2 family transporter protein [Anthocerotibacter panamensis]